VYEVRVGPLLFCNHGGNDDDDDDADDGGGDDDVSHVLRRTSEIQILLAVIAMLLGTTWMANNFVICLKVAFLLTSTRFPCYF